MRTDPPRGSFRLMYNIEMHNDSLYRISLKCLIKNSAGDVLVVKEAGREFWDLPGGGMEHGDDINTAIARELKEEVDYEGDFTFSTLSMDEPVRLLSRDVWQLRIILNVTPSTFTFSAGEDADEIQFINPAALKDSDSEHEQKAYQYAATDR